MSQGKLEHRHTRLSRQGVKFSPRGHRDELRNEVESVVQLQSRRESERGTRLCGRTMRKKEREPAERDIKVFRVAKVAAAAATSKRPPTAGLWLRLSARVPACVCVRSCTRSRLSRERSSRGDWLGFDGASIPVEPVRSVGRVRAISACMLLVSVYLYTYV